MQVISFKSTVLFKRGIWLSAAALIAFVFAPSALDGSLRQNPTSGLFAAAVLGAFFVYLLWKTQFHRLADEVLDCEDHLKVRRGRVEVTIPFSKVAAAASRPAAVSTGSRFDCVNPPGWAGKSNFCRRQVYGPIFPG
jgi:hypothetical protein